MPHKYTAWGFYNDPADPRLVVPKLNPALGWTVNVAHPSSRRALAMMAIVLVGGIAGSVFLR